MKSDELGAGTVTYAITGVRARHAEVVERLDDPTGLLDHIDATCQAADIVVVVRHSQVATDVAQVLRALALAIVRRAAAVEQQPWGEA